MLIIFDKDGTLVGGPEGRPPNTLEEQRLLPGVAEKCAALVAGGHTLAVASNQGGVAFGYMQPYMARVLVRRAAEDIGAELYEVCYHHPGGTIPVWSIPCPCRKPAPGMLWALMLKTCTHPEQTVFVGDQDSDRAAAKAAGVGFVWASDFFGWGEGGEQ